MDAQRGISRRMVIGLPPEGLTPAWERDFASFAPAGVILFARDFRSLDDLRALTSRLRELARPRRLFLAIDEEGGFVSQLGAHLTVPPNALLLARGAAPGDLEWASRVTGERLRALGVDWVFAPVADVHSRPRNPVIGPRAYATDPERTAACIAEVVRGFRASGIACCLKHFPGHGDTVLDSHFALPRCDADRATLEARELVPFRAGLEAGSVMSAHVVYPALDPERPATFSRAVITDLLHGALGFAGLCVTDALEMKGAAQERTPFQAGAAALEAGCDLLMFAHWSEPVRRVRLELADALVEGRVDRASYDAARPRLAEFDRLHPEPTAEELARPIASLTPTDWEPRLEGIVERGLIVRGALPEQARALPWRLTEPPFAYGPTLREELERAGLRVSGRGPAIEIVAVMSRTSLPPEETERLRALCAAGPTVVVGLQNDAFLDDLPAAAVRISAADATPLTRRVVARRLAALMRTPA